MQTPALLKGVAACLGWAHSLIPPEATRRVCYYSHIAELDPEAPKVTVTFRSEQSWDLSRALYDANAPLAQQDRMPLPVWSVGRRPISARSAAQSLTRGWGTGWCEMYRSSARHVKPKAGLGSMWSRGQRWATEELRAWHWRVLGATCVRRENRLRTLRDFGGCLPAAAQERPRLGRLGPWRALPWRGGDRSPSFGLHVPGTK